MTTNDEIREKVSEAYVVALRRSQEGGGACCAPQSACAEPAGAAAKLADYTTELRAFAEAGASSLGCGNPLAFAGVQAGDTVVDLGSGAGFDLLIAAEKVGPDGLVIGIDMTDEMNEAARANAAAAGFTNVELRKGVIEELPVEDGSADWIISNCVVNLSPEKERVFTEIHRVLKPGGRFSISDIVVDELPESVRALAGVYTACVGGAISEHDYIAGLRSAGLIDVNVSERLIYEDEQIRDLIAGDLDWSGEACAVQLQDLPSLAGKVASVKLVGRKPR